MTNEAMNFDLSVVEIPITITKKDRTKKECILREASGDAVINYNNARSSAMKYNKDGNISGTVNISDVIPLLISSCMMAIERGADGSITNETPIQITELRSWPNRVVKSLFKKVREISDIDDDSKVSLLEQRAEIDEQLKTLEEEEEKVKNLERDMTDGSA